MAIAFDTAGYGEVNPGTSVTFALTLGSSANALVLFSTDPGFGGASDISGITYNGAAMTKITAMSWNNTQMAYETCWYKLAPSTGSSYNVVVTLAHAGGYNTSMAASYSGVQQSGIPDASATNNAASGTTFALTVSSSANNCWHVGASFTNQASAISAGSGTTARTNSAGTGYRGMLCDSNAAKTPAGSYTLNSSGPEGYWGGMILTLPPLIVTGPTNVKTFNNLATASVKTVNGLAIASVKSKNGLT